MDYRFSELHEHTFLEVLGSGVYHSTELFCDYVPKKLYPPQGWKSYLDLELGSQIMELNHWVYMSTQTFKVRYTTLQFQRILLTFKLVRKM